MPGGHLVFNADAIGPASLSSLGQLSAPCEYYTLNCSSADDSRRSLGLCELVEPHLELRHQAIPLVCAFLRCSIAWSGHVADSGHSSLRLECAHSRLRHARILARITPAHSRGLEHE